MREENAKKDAIREAAMPKKDADMSAMKAQMEELYPLIGSTYQ